MLERLDDCKKFVPPVAHTFLQFPTLASYALSSSMALSALRSVMTPTVAAWGCGVGHVEGGEMRGGRRWEGEEVERGE